MFETPIEHNKYLYWLPMELSTFNVLIPNFIKLIDSLHN